MPSIDKNTFLGRLARMFSLKSLFTIVGRTAVIGVLLSGLLMFPKNSGANPKFHQILPEFRSLISNLNRTQVPILLPARVPVETIEVNPEVELPSSISIKEGHFVTFFPYIVDIEPTRYSVSLDLVPDCMGAVACTFGEISGQKITSKTAKIPETFTIHQQMWQDPNNRNIPKSLEPPSRVQLTRGIVGYFVPYFCATACDSSRIIWDLNGYRYQVGIKAANKQTVLDMANSAIQNQLLP